MHLRRVVITGLGVVAPNGHGKDAFWQACLQGRSGIRTITRFDATALPIRIAGEVENFSPPVYGLTEFESRVLDRSAQFAIAAANMALDDAGCLALSEVERERMGVYMGTAMATVDEGLACWSRLTSHGTHAPRTLLEYEESIALMLSYTPSAAVAAHHDLRGPSLTLSTGCSSGADAIGQAFWLIQEGRAERMLAGGSDAAISPLGIGVFSVMRALSTNNAEPERASRPYDVRRDGFVLSEGAAVVFLEERELALARGAHIYAELLSFVTNGNAYHMTALPENGVPLQSLLLQAMEETGISGEQLGYINSHGSSTPTNDIAETIAYKSVFGTRAFHIPISSTKSLIGHTQGAASAIEAVVTALALDQQILPPTINLEQPDPLCDLDYIPLYPRQLDPQHPLLFALTHSSGFGGVNTALVMAKHEVSTHTFQMRSSVEMQQQPVSPSSGHPGPFLRFVDLSLRRVVVTGLGVVAPGGVEKESFWEALCAGRDCRRPLARYSEAEPQLHVAGKIEDFRPGDYLDRKLIHRTVRMTHLALVASQQALRDAQLLLDREDPRRIGAVIANALGGGEYVLQQMEPLYRRGPNFVSVYTAIAWLHVANIGQLSMRYGLQGYCKTPVNDTASGLDALGMAYTAIRRGVADVLITGGTEAPLNAEALHILGASLPFCKEDFYRPFDRRADGIMIAEGAGVCILEEYEHARRRDAPIYGEIIGYGQTSTPHMMGLPVQSDRTSAVRSLRLALAEAHLEPTEIGQVYLDGRAIAAWDNLETDALREVFGDVFKDLACSVPRTQFGHALAAAGVLDTISALLGMREGLIPPTINCDEPDPQSVPPGLVRDQTREQRRGLQETLICSRSLGGSHGVLALRNI